MNESHQLSPLHTISIMPATIHQLMPAVNEGLVMDDEEIGASEVRAFIFFWVEQRKLTRVGLEPMTPAL